MIRSAWQGLIQLSCGVSKSQTRGLITAFVSRFRLGINDPQAVLGIGKEADDLVQLLTPLVKSYLSEIGHDTAQMAIQVYGGHGYIQDNGVEQYGSAFFGWE